MRIAGMLRIYDVYSSQKTNTQRLTRAEEKKDMVAFSCQARDYATAAKAVKDAADIRQDKVSEIQSRFEAGTYYVSAAAVADKIISCL